MSSSALRPAPKGDATAVEHEGITPTSVSAKAVQIAEPGSHPPVPEEVHQKKPFLAGPARRLNGRPATPCASSHTSIIGQNSIDGSTGSPNVTTASPSRLNDQQPHRHRHRHRHRQARVTQRLLAQVAEWMHHEKFKRDSRRKRLLSRGTSEAPRSGTETNCEAVAEGQHEQAKRRSRTPSIASTCSNISFDRLQRIIEDGMAGLGLSSLPACGPKGSGHGGRRSKRSPRSLSLTNPSRAGSSDTEYADGDARVPACNAFLDNSKALAHSGGGAANESQTDLRREKDRQAWIAFKSEVIRLAHTLKLKGWRRVPLESGANITVERLSGALTNAVYVVSPPADLGDQQPTTATTDLLTVGKSSSSPSLPAGHRERPPPKLLLRIYGPQVEHLIDRENELNVLRRLARQKIGPRLLGTFLNGRFEQYFNATALTPVHLREPDTSKQIAKRMRELHDGIALLEEERDAGPAVWRNWDRWLGQVEKTILLLDGRVTKGELDGYLCGVEWHIFRAMVDKYRKYLESHYGGSKAIRGRLVFSHNDTQYGNILRVRPDAQKSPLLQPANNHKHLIVIDFEYAGPNVPGLEFANHFTEWAYNYHDTTAPYRCNTANYPCPDQQHRFLRAYIDHRAPTSKHLVGEDSTPLLTPSAADFTTHEAASSAASSVLEFMLDAKVQPSGGWKEEDTESDEAAERNAKELMDETKLWRAANSAQWVAWGIVQARVPELEALVGIHGEAESEGQVDYANEAGEEEFDYLAYAHDRALFFWGDMVLLGLVKEEELSKGLRAHLKIVRW